MIREADASECGMEGNLTILLMTTCDTCHISCVDWLCRYHKTLPPGSTTCGRRTLDGCQSRNSINRVCTHLCAGEHCYTTGISRLFPIRFSCATWQSWFIPTIWHQLTIEHAKGELRVGTSLVAEPLLQWTCQYGISLFGGAHPWCQETLAAGIHSFQSWLMNTQAPAQLHIPAYFAG